MQEIRDVNTFKIGSVLTVPNLEDYEKITIQRISDSGVTVSGPKCGNNVVISGRTPAIPYVEKEILLEKQSNNKNMTTENANVATPEVANDTNPNRAKRGSLKAKMAALKMPANPFTVKQLADLNDIPASYANAWAKTNAKEAGNVEKVEGKRGRVASLYTV